MLVALTLTVLGTMLWRAPENAQGYVRDVTASAFAALYVPFLAGFAALMLRPDDGPDRVVVFIDWAYSYFTYQPGVRLITDVERYKPPAAVSG